LCDGSADRRRRPSSGAARHLLPPGEGRGRARPGDRYAAEVQAEAAAWRARGIIAVPSVVINGQDLITGGQPAAVFEEVLRRVAGAGAG
jgi:hypothetical protein